MITSIGAVRFLFRPVFKRLCAFFRCAVVNPFRRRLWPPLEAPFNIIGTGLKVGDENRGGKGASTPADQPNRKWRVKFTISSNSGLSERVRKWSAISPPPLPTLPPLSGHRHFRFRRDCLVSATP